MASADGTEIVRTSGRWERSGAPLSVSSVSAESLVAWINRGLEFLWLLTIVLVPVAFVTRGELISASAIAYLEVPKIAILRTLVGLMAILWLIEWGINSRLSMKPLSNSAGFNSRPRAWIAGLGGWLGGQPTRWIILAVLPFLATTILSTALSASFEVSLWGQVPGEDGYSTYTVISYILLFGIIATHLKTKPQLMRLLASVALMGTLTAGYAILQHHGYDPFDLTDPPNTLRSTSTMGNPILAASLMLMTIPVSLVMATIYLQRPARSLGFWLGLALGASFLTVQLLGIYFTDSRGPWAGSVLSFAAFFALAAVFLGWRLLLRASLAMALAAVLALAVITVPSLTDSEPDAAERVSASATTEDPASTSNIVPNSGSDSGPPTVAEPRARGPAVAAGVSRAVTVVSSQAGSRGLEGRIDIWKDSWRLMIDRPWFEFDNLSLKPLRSVIGYGPDLFRYTYMLESTPRGGDLLPLEPAHAHNYFIHQGVEAGFLGMLSSFGIYAVPLLVGAYLLLRKRRNHSTIQTLLIIGLLAIIVGRALEQMTGLARVSDLTIFWVLLGVFAALPIALKEPEHEHAPSARFDRSHPPGGRQLMPNLQSHHWLGVIAIVCLIGGIAALTWIKTINYPRAAVFAAQGVSLARDGDLEGGRTKLDQAIKLAPDVWINYTRLSVLYSAYRTSEEQARNPGCAAHSNQLEYDRCLAKKINLTDLAGAEQRPFNFRSLHTLALSTLDLARLEEGKSDEDGLRLLNDVSALVPTAWQIYNQLAEAYLQNGQPDAAFGPLDKSLAITEDSGSSAKAYLLRGVAYRDLDQLLMAIADFDKAVQIAPFDSVYGTYQENYEAYNYRALTYLALGQPQQAISDWGNAIKSNPRYAEAYSNRGLLYLTLGHPQLAIDDLDEAIRFNPQYSVAYINRGLAYADQERYQQAIADYDEAIRLDPTYVQAYVNRGVAYADLGEPERALRDHEAAITLEPRHAGAHALGAVAYTLGGQDALARRELETAVGLGFKRVELEARILSLAESR